MRHFQSLGNKSAPALKQIKQNGVLLMPYGLLQDCSLTTEPIKYDHV